jgi:hypothetical protein
VLDMAFDCCRRQRGGAMRFKMDELVVLWFHSDQAPVRQIGDGIEKPEKGPRTTGIAF